MNKIERKLLSDLLDLTSVQRQYATARMKNVLHQGEAAVAKFDIKHYAKVARQAKTARERTEAIGDLAHVALCWVGQKNSSANLDASFQSGRREGVMDGQKFAIEVICGIDIRAGVKEGIISMLLRAIEDGPSRTAAQCIAEFNASTALTLESALTRAKMYEPKKRRRK